MANLATVNGNGKLSTGQWNSEQIKILKDQIAKDCTDSELALFGQICQRTGLDPFAKQIYALKRGKGDNSKMTIQTSIDGYRLIADRTGKHAGTDDAVFDEGISLFHHIKEGRGYPVIATVTVWKIVSGERCPFTASASWDQYKQEFDEWNNGKRTGTKKLGDMWAKMPHLMLSKCAEALALRKAFPAELSGLYTADEMAQAENDVTVMEVDQSKPVTVKAVEVQEPSPLETLQAWAKENDFDFETEVKPEIRKALGFSETTKLTGKAVKENLTNEHVKKIINILFPPEFQPDEDITTVDSEVIED